MEHDKKSDDLESFLEKEVRRELEKDSTPQADQETGDVVWNAAQAAVEHGKARNVREAAEAVLKSDAFSHLGEDAQAVITKTNKEQRVEEATEALAGDAFQMDSAMAGAAQADPEPDPFLFSAVSTTSEEGEEEIGDIFGGGGDDGDGEDKDKDKGSRKPKDADSKKKKSAKEKPAKGSKGKKSSGKGSGKPDKK